MNKLFSKIIGASLAIAMMIGTAVSASNSRQFSEVNAAVVGTFERTSIENLTAGDVVLIVNNNNKAMSNDNGTSSAPSAVNVSVSNNTITNPAENLVWTFGISEDNYTFLAGTSGSNYLYCTNTNNGVRVGTNSNNTFTVDGGYLKNVATSRYVGVYNNQDWRCYTSSGTNISGQTFSYFKQAQSSFGTLHHIKINNPASKLLFESGETFSSSGLTLIGYDGENEETANTASYTSGYTTNYDNHTFLRSEATGEKTVTVTYEGKTTTYTINVVPGPDFVHTYSNNSVFGSTSYSTTETATHTPTSGPEYITLGGYNYSKNQTQAMSLANVSGAYFGNNEEYELNSEKKNINKIIIKTNSDVSDKVVMTEGPIALSEDATVEPTLSNSNKTLTYEFSGNNPFFKFKSTSAWYINMTSITVYLGTAATVATVTEVAASIKEGTYLTGSTLSASDFEVFASWSNGNVTEPTSGFTWTVRGIDNGTLIEGNNEVIVTYQNIHSDPFNVVGTSIHATSVEIQEANSITLMVEGTVTLHATITPSNNMDSTVWSSNNEDVATVSNSGVVTAHSIGVATITITVGSVSSSRQIIVSSPAKTSYSLIKVGTTSGYANSSDVTFPDGKIWNIPGNQTLDDGLKLGGNLKTALNRSLYSKSSYNYIKNVTVYHGGKDDVVTVNSITLLVYNSAENASSGSEDNADDVVEGVYAENDKTVFVPSSGSAWENKFFRIVYNLSSTTTSNKGIYLTKLELGIPNPENNLESSSSIKTISATESNGGATVENVALRFGGIIPVSDWNAINSNWPITDYGVMFARGSMLTARSLETLEAVFRNDADDVAMVHRGSVGTPNANGDNYVFTARLNLEEADYDEVFYAAPFIVAGGEYYFLPEMHYSVRTLAEECYNNGGSSLSQTALATLKGNN